MCFGDQVTLPINKDYMTHKKRGTKFTRGDNFKTEKFRATIKKTLNQNYLYQNIDQPPPFLSLGTKKNREPRHSLPSANLFPQPSSLSSPSTSIFPLCNPPPTYHSNQPSPYLSSSSSQNKSHHFPSLTWQFLLHITAAHKDPTTPVLVFISFNQP